MMRVYTKIVFDMSSMKVVSECSYEYLGDILLLKGGSSGGGGTSGKVDYPDYMKTIHGEWLGQISDLIDVAHGASPFAGDSAFDPAQNIEDMMDEVCWFNDLVHNLDWEADWESAADAAKSKVDSWIDNTYILSATNAHSAVLADNISDTVLPKFESGMRDQNAVYSSAFVIGESIIYAMKDRDVAKFDADLRTRLHLLRNELLIKATDSMMANLARLVSAAQNSAHYAIEGNRIAIVAEKEKVDQDLLIEDKDARWDLDVYQYGANMLASIGGGTAQPGSIEGGKAPSAIGGALSGAAAGAMLAPALGMSGPIGAGIGGLIGLFGGIFT